MGRVPRVRVIPLQLSDPILPQSRPYTKTFRLRKFSYFKSPSEEDAVACPGNLSHCFTTSQPAVVFSEKELGISAVGPPPLCCLWVAVFCWSFHVLLYAWLNITFGPIQFLRSLKISFPPSVCRPAHTGERHRGEGLSQETMTCSGSWQGQDLKTEIGFPGYQFGGYSLGGP